MAAEIKPVFFEVRNVGVDDCDADGFGAAGEELDVEFGRGCRDCGGDDGAGLDVVSAEVDCYVGLGVEVGD